MNRAYLLFSLVFSIALPFLSIGPGSLGTDALPEVSLPEVVVNPSADPVLQPVLKVAVWIYWTGAVLAALLVLRSVMLILRSRSGAVSRTHSISDYFVSEGHHAFSFFNRIHIGRSVEPQLRDMILAHEHVHKRQWHSLDVLCFALAPRGLVVQPRSSTWRLAKCRLNHEFLADRENGYTFWYGLPVQPLESSLGNQVLSADQFIFFPSHSLKTEYS